MSFASRVIALAFVAIGVFLATGEATAHDRRVGAAAIAFGLGVWCMEFALRAHGADLAAGRRRREGATVQRFWPPRRRLALTALSAAGLGAAPLLISGVALWPVALAALPLLAAGFLAVWAAWPGAVVEIGPEGLIDRRIMRAPVPWSAPMTVQADGLGLLLHTAPQAYRREGVAFWGRRPDGFIVSALLLDGDASDLAQAVRRHHAVLDLGEAPDFADDLGEHQA